MTGLIRAEILKLLKRKLYWVMLLIFAGVMGMVAVLLIVLPPLAPEAFEGFPGIERPDAYLFGATQAIGQRPGPRSGRPGSRRSRGGGCTCSPRLS